MSVAKTYAVRDSRINNKIHSLFWTGLLQNKVYLVLAYLLIPAYFLMYIFIPLQVAFAIQAIVAKDFEAINHYILIIVIAAIAQVITNSLASWAHHRLGIRACAYVQRTIFANYLDKDYDFYSDQYVGSLGAQAAQLRDSCSMYSEIAITQVSKNGTIIFGGIVVIALNSMILAIITLGCMFAVLSFTMATSTYRMRYRRKVSEAGSELAGVLGDALGHGATVKSFASEEYEQKRLDTSIKKWRVAQLKSWDAFIPAHSGRNLLNFAALAILIFATAKMYQAGTIEVAIVVLVQLYMVRLLATTSDLAEVIKRYEEVMGGAYASVKTMLIPQKVQDVKNPVKLNTTVSHIMLENVSYRYKMTKKTSYAVKDFSLSIPAGTKIGLVGYSGSGKTTLTKLLLRFMDVTSGKILLNDVDVRDLRQKDLRLLISYVPQEPLLFHRSVIENIAYGRPEATKDEIYKAAKLACVDEFVLDMPNGYDTIVGERGVKLSGGQRQRVAIARAILKDAPILVLDEATSALDSKSEQLIQKALTNLMKNRTSIVIAHRLSTIQRLDEIVVMERGKIVEKGTHSDLVKQKGPYAELWQHQSGGYIGAENEE